ncbi:pirin family protein [Streptomyces sp. SID8014]|uniref:pirin family protein n=1 Tax=Streptomyces sp. SID8014 TaxID=2706097 RepID=UPI0031BA4731
MVRVIDVRRSGDRYQGGEPSAGISTLHAFSFGAHYDPDNLRFGPLIACNEERLAPGAGFDEHPHSHTEIVTWVAEGELTHQDSTGRTTVVRPGDVQHLSAATGVRHVERNDGPAPLVFLQMWLAPLTSDGAPTYSLARREDLPQDRPDTVVLDLPAAGAALHRLLLVPGRPNPLPPAALRHVHVLTGDVELSPASVTGEDHSPPVRLGPGDSARVGETAPNPRTLISADLDAAAARSGSGQEGGESAGRPFTVTGRGEITAELLVWTMRG